MRKSMAILAFLAATQLSAVHATSGGKNLDGGSVEKYFNNEYLTDDLGQFQIHVRPNHSLVEVDFSSVAVQTAPVTIEGSNFAINLNGDAHVLTSYEGLPATYWFGDQAESTFVLANSSMQIVFPQDVYAASLMINASTYNQKLQLELETITDVKAGTMLIDANGNMIGEGSINLTTGGPAFLGILSDIPFRSLIISSTAETWMFSNLNYAVDQDKPMLKEGNVSGTATADEEKLTSCHSDGSGNTEQYKSGSVLSARGVQPICANRGN